jgi:hypothetical protein
MTKGLNNVLVCFGFLFAIFISGCSNSPEIQLVKTGHLNNYPNKTIGEAVGGFFGSPHWESGIGSDGETKGKKLVNATGKISYMGKEVEAKIQFVINDDDKSFVFRAFELNGIPQNQLMIIGLISKMYGDSTDTNK